MKSLIVTEKQLQIIKDACELYGRIQIGQFGQFAEIVTQTGFSGYEIRVKPKRKDDETDERYKARCNEQYDKDSIICDCIEGVLDGIYRNVYPYYKSKTNEAEIALDIWAVLDGRREDGFHMGSEPLVQVKVEEE